MISSLSPLKLLILFFISFVIVAFGQPAWNDWLSLLSAILGFACFWRVLLTIPKAKHRFLIAFIWFAGVQAIQLSWFYSHPFWYVYGVVLFCATLMGAQFGLLAIWITPQSLSKIRSLLALTGAWTLLEWSRLFVLSGLPFNPLGLTLSSSLYSLQMASLAGVYGLSFWVILTNLFFLRAWISSRSMWKWASVCGLILIPYGFGWGHLHWHKSGMTQHPTNLSVVLVQSGLPIEENLTFKSAEDAYRFVLQEWRQVLTPLKKQFGQKIDLIVFPEYLVPYGTFHAAYPLDEVEELFKELFNRFERLPFYYTPGDKAFVSNAYIAQSLANLFQAHLVIGLEEGIESKEGFQHYSSAFHFIPEATALPDRYDKQILVPMGEYIPFEWCRQLASKYGITGSFTCGQGAKLMHGPVPFGTSICYEEIFGHLMRENRLKGAELLLNLTNDGWYPHSRLPKQHFDHARLRTVENGIPLLRACNTGITAGLNSLGEVVQVLNEDQALTDALHLQLPLYHYRTLYSQYGDFPILLLSGLFLIIGLYPRKHHTNL